MTFQPWESVNRVQVSTVQHGTIIGNYEIPFFTATEADAWVMADVVAAIIAREQGGSVTRADKRDFPTDNDPED